MQIVSIKGDDNSGKNESRLASHASLESRDGRRATEAEEAIKTSRGGALWTALFVERRNICSRSLSPLNKMLIWVSSPYRVWTASPDGRETPLIDIK